MSDLKKSIGEKIVIARKVKGLSQSALAKKVNVYQQTLSALERIGFEETTGVPYLAHTVSSCGSYLSKEAGVPQGSALAYLIAPPLESMYALDAALKSSDVKLCKLYPPPSETNFGGALLTGTRSACASACEAFATAVTEVASSPR